MDSVQVASTGATHFQLEEEAQVTTNGFFWSENRTETYLDLNGGTVDVKELVYNGTAYNRLYVTPITKGKLMSFENGTINYGNIGNNGSNASFVPHAGATIELNNVTLNAECTGIYPQGDTATVSVINSKINANGYYGIGTNAATVDNWNVVINIENSEVRANANYSVGVMINIPATLNVKNSTLSGKRFASFVRGGTAVYENTTLDFNYNPSVEVDPASEQQYYTGEWGGAVSLPSAALTIGNRNSGAYKYDTDVTLKGVTFNMLNTEKTGLAIYAGNYFGTDTFDVGLTYDENTMVQVGETKTPLVMDSHSCGYGVISVNGQDYDFGDRNGPDIPVALPPSDTSSGDDQDNA